ncbi:Thioredoxin-like fold containing protein [Parasponia andersonii]|uniref:Thioredoxin-like fold containing protein n=1 Tax=Parasponia andersonii TaxID=3476 RepID=A0A2P5CXH3_PARAD|nr:Thioredoxin-like fold containing protein [Parasponia andersonii]
MIPSDVAESRQIIRYIANEYAHQGTELLHPDSKKQEATILVWLEVRVVHLAVVEEINEFKLTKVLDVYEVGWLSQNNWKWAASP